MACGIPWDQDSRASERIAGDRRSDRRYPILLDLRWKLVRRKRVLDMGIGSTLDLSSGGILFKSSRPLPEGLNVELAISWPALLHNLAPLQLIVRGRIVRSAGGLVAIRMKEHEFHTVASNHIGNGVPADGGHRHTPFLPTIHGTTNLGKIQ